MIPLESIDVINRRLIDFYSVTEDRPNFRIVWSDNQYENRLVTHTEEGLELLHSEVRRVRKYSYIKERFILERLTVIPYVDEKELPESELSYEPIYVFEDRHGNALPPAWIAAKFVVDQVHKQLEDAGLYTKHKDPLAGLNTKELLEAKRVEIKQMEEALFGNETEVTDALAYREGVGFTTSKIKES